MKTAAQQKIIICRWELVQWVWTFRNGHSSPSPILLIETECTLKLCTFVYWICELWNWNIEILLIALSDSGCSEWVWCAWYGWTTAVFIRTVFMESSQADVYGLTNRQYNGFWNCDNQPFYVVHAPTFLTWDTKLIQECMGCVKNVALMWSDQGWSFGNHSLTEGLQQG